MDDKSATAGPQQALPLAGIRVIELGQNIATVVKIGLEAYANAYNE